MMIRQLVVCASAFAALAAAQTVKIDPSPESVPAWAEQGKMRFARFDGGPIEIRKTARSRWGRHFTDEQKEVLGNLYSKYGDRMIEAFQKANVNAVWLTWSVGYSWQEEAEQREQCKRMVGKLHEKGFHAAAYMCAVSMFWETMFRDEPRSVRWLLFDPQGVPYRYSSGLDPLRFIADVRNPEWVEYEKRRIDGAIDAGFDAIFIDNTAGFRDDDGMEEFIGKLRRYIREEKRSNIALLTNYGLAPSRAVMNRNMDIVFAEYWREPGVWGSEWDISNVRRAKYLRGIQPDWKPFITEYSNFHGGATRNTRYLNAKSAKLSIAEAAALRTGYAWNMEGPFDAAVMNGDAPALETWSAIGQYNGFLKDHEDLYVKPASAAAVAVLLSAKVNGNAPVSFGWERENSGLYDLLAKKSVQYDIRLADVLDEAQLKQYRGVVVPDFVVLGTAQEQMLEKFRSGGGRVYRVPKGASEADVLKQVRALAPDGPWIEVEGAPYVTGHLVKSGEGRLALHLLNYAPEAASRLRIRVSGVKTGGGKLLTPDSGTHGLGTFRSIAPGVEFTLDALDTYAVVRID
jgi:hypothetical protein